MNLDNIVLDDPQGILNDTELRGCEWDLRRLRDLAPYGAQIHSEVMHGGADDYVCSLKIVHKSGLFEALARERRPRIAVHSSCQEIERKLKLWKLERQFDGKRAA